MASTIYYDYITPLPQTTASHLSKLKVDVEDQDDDSDPGESTAFRAAMKKKEVKVLPHAVVNEGEVDPAVDVANQNLRMLLRDLLVLDEFLGACAAGDIGRIEDLFPFMLILFRGANGTNYANKLMWAMLGLKHLWSPEFAYEHLTLQPRSCTLIYLQRHYAGWRSSQHARLPYSRQFELRVYCWKIEGIYTCLACAH